MRGFFQKFIFLAVILILFLLIPAKAQHRYWVFLKDKKDVIFNPYKYFDKKAIERRLKQNISLFDSSDFPLNENYIKRIEALAFSVNCKLRWFNAVSVVADNQQINLIGKLPFVREILVQNHSDFIPAATYDTLLDPDETDLLEKQIDRMQGRLFGASGFNGKGIRIAIFDAGYSGLKENPVLKHLILNHQIIASWDFAKKKDFVYSYNDHGTMVVSCIAGKIGNKLFGLAPGAEFLLARTETGRESSAEEEYWLQAMEWADKNGADIINSSLAYTHERYYTFEMNGHTSMVSKAATMAANKGMLVINAMGNDGNHDWKIVATPADADSVLSVGAISPVTDYHASFSSFGPTSDYRLKPNVVAYGQIIASGESKLEKVKGTSFAAPLVTGFAACAWQIMPYLSNMQLFKKIEESGHLYPYFDYAHGYGVPQASFFLKNDEIHETEATFSFIQQKDTLFIEVNEKFINRQFLQSNNYLYYHVETSNNYLEDYWLIDVYSKRPAFIMLKDYQAGSIIRVHYKGFTNSFTIE
ncbi:MAG: S8 family serine peptidase [Bacteroidales bacterium]